MPSKKCVQCSKTYEKKEFTSKTNWENSKFCSRECKHQSGRIVKICLNCGAMFHKPKNYKNGDFKFCSQTCSNRYNTDQGKTGFYQGHPKYKNCDFWKGKIRSDDYKKSMSEAMKNSTKSKVANIIKGLNSRGANHWNWKGGITDINKSLRQQPEYHKWRLSVYKRDHYTCRCGIHCTMKNIVAHHIKSWKEYPELRYSIDNGITLCRKCHKIEHKEIGYGTRFKK